MKREASDALIEYSCVHCPHVGDHILDLRLGAVNQAAFICPNCGRQTLVWTF